jgi:hypothetical protein
MAILRLNEASISNQKPGQAWLFFGEADVNRRQQCPDSIELPWPWRRRSANGVPLRL